ALPRLSSAGRTSSPSGACQMGLPGIVYPSPSDPLGSAPHGTRLPTVGRRRSCLPAHLGPFHVARNPATPPPSPRGRQSQRYGFSGIASSPASAAFRLRGPERLRLGAASARGGSAAEVAGAVASGTVSL